MHGQCARGIALLGLLSLALGLGGCASSQMAEPAGSGKSKAPAAASSAPQEEQVKTQEPKSSAVESIDVMVQKLQKKQYACTQWKQTNDVKGPAASGTCNGKDKVMWFDDQAKVAEQAKALDAEGINYVIGDNWIVANTKTPTFVRNALDGKAVPAK